MALHFPPLKLDLLSTSAPPAQKELGLLPCHAMAAMPKNIIETSVSQLCRPLRRWLQRDFGIYVVNLFDTGQAARVLEFSGLGLKYLLQHFCGVQVRDAKGTLNPKP